MLPTAMLMQRKKYGMSMVEVFSKNMEKLKKIWGIWISFLFLLILSVLFFNLPLIVLEICFVIHCILSVSALVTVIIKKDYLKDYLPETLVVLEEKLEAKLREAMGTGVLIIIVLFLVRIDKMLATNFMAFIAVISFITVWLFYIFYNIYSIKKKIYKIKKHDKNEL